ncbi:MAG: hypothetical protein F7C35_07910 [Desulfurococcales archaeon]|nr:hypothetical protein [Desulfurococcales archaeon]
MALKQILASLAIVAIALNLLPGTGLLVGQRHRHIGGPVTVFSGPVAEDVQWYLTVLPFFLQETPRDLGSDYGYAEAYVQFFGPGMVVVDVNHNGQFDPGEPYYRTNETDFHVVKIGYDDYGNVPDIELSPGYGPLWILSDTPVFVSYFVKTGLGGDEVAAYAMPPPGLDFYVPPLPGHLYISPAGPWNVTVIVNSTDVYNINKGQYLMLPHSGGHVLRLHSNRPIVAALIHFGDGYNDTYMTEVIPVSWYSSDVDILITEHSLYSIDDNGDVYVFAIDNQGRCGAAKAEDDEVTINDEEGNILYPGRISVLYEYIRGNYSGQYGSDVMPIYNLTKWGEYYGGKVSAWIYKFIVVGPEALTYQTVAALRDDVDMVYFSDTQYNGTGFWAEGKQLYVENQVGRYYHVTALSTSGPPGYIIFTNINSLTRVYATLRAFPVPQQLEEEAYQKAFGGEPEDVSGPHVPADTAASVHFTGDRLRIWAWINSSNATGITLQVISPDMTILDNVSQPGGELTYSNEITLNETVWEHLKYGRVGISMFINTSQGEVHRIVWMDYPMLESNPPVPCNTFYEEQPSPPPSNTTSPPSNESNTTSTRTGTTTPAETSSTTQSNTLTTTTTKENPLATLGLENGSKLEYTVTYTLKSRNNSMSGEGRVIFQVVVEGDEVTVRPLNITLPPETIVYYAAGHNISDLFSLITQWRISGQNAIAPYDSDLNPLFDEKCPILRPGAGSTQNTGSFTVTSTTGKLTVSYSCSYKDGILRSINMRLNGTGAGGWLDFKTEATLKGGESGGGTPGSQQQESGEKGGMLSNRNLMIAVMAVIVILSVVILLKRLR